MQINITDLTFRRLRHPSATLDLQIKKLINQSINHLFA